MRNKLILVGLLMATLTVMSGFAQDIVTAEKYFDAVSQHYGTVKDYQAQVTITHNDQTMKGMLFYKTPNLLRINFTDPKDQVLVVDGIQLMIYLPLHHVLMRQEITRHSKAALASMASQQGLKLLKQNYSVAFLEGPNTVPLDKGSDEMVRKLKLVWRTPGQGFRQIVMSVDKNMQIRRLVGITDSYDTFQFDFIDIRINQDIPTTKFKFDSPPSAYTLENFLFKPES